MKRRSLSTIVCLALLSLFCAPANAGQWKNSPWLGLIFETGPAPSWFHREGFGWSYAYQDPSGASAWLHVPGFGFVWSSQEAWPWFYSSLADNWFYELPGSADPTYYFDSSSGRWGVAPTEFLTASSRSEMSFTPVSAVPDPLPFGDLFAVPGDLRIQNTGVKSFGGIQVRELAATSSANIRIGQDVQIRMFTEGDALPLGSAPGFLNVSRNGATFTIGVGPDGDKLRTEAWSWGYEKLGHLAFARKIEDGHVLDLYEGGFRQPGGFNLRFGLAADSVVVMPLGEMTLQVNRDEPSVLTGEVIADTGFRPNPDGLGFENFVDTRPSDLTEEDIRLLLGDQAVWTEPGGGTVLKATARLIAEPLLDNMKGGHCFGMGIVGMRLFEEIPLSTSAVGVGGVDPTAAEAIDLQKFQLRNPVTVDMARQFTSADLYSEILASGAAGPTAAFADILDAFDNGDTIPVLGLQGRDGSGGHAVSPYAITDQGGGVVHLHVWDNNFPDNAELAVEIDLVFDTWRFVNTGPRGGTPYPEFNGDATTGNFGYVTWEMLENYQPSAQPGMIRVQASEDNQLFVSADDGRRIGYDFETGTIVRAFPGAEILPVFDINSSPNYLIPIDPGGDELPDSVDLLLDEMLEVRAGPGRNATDEEVDFSLYLTGETFVSELGGVSLDEGEVFDFLFHPSGRVFVADGEEVPVSELGFEFAVNDDPAQTGYLFEFEEIQVPEGSSVLVLVNADFVGEVFEITSEGTVIPLQPDQYESTRRVVGVGFD